MSKLPNNKIFFDFPKEEPMPGSAMDEARGVVFTEEDVQPYVEEMDEFLKSNLRKARSASGGDAVQPEDGSDEGIVIIDGVRYRKA